MEAPIDGLTAAVPIEPVGVDAATPASPTPGTESRPAPVTAAQLREGETLLAAAGSFPVLSCSYERFGGFFHYARAMHALGARFVVVRQRRIVGEWDLAERRLQTLTLAGAYSPRARDYSEEPALRDVTRSVREEFGTGAELMMVVPKALDAGLFGGIAQGLRERGDSHAGYRELRGRYERSAEGGVRIRIEQGLRDDGGVTPIELVFDLGEIAALAGPAAG